MRKVIVIAFAILFYIPVWSQTVRQELAENNLKASSNYYAYPVPAKNLTPAPKGKKPFYISHYGRHGSRYLINQREYDYPFATFSKADSLGKLTEAGKKTFDRIRQLRDEAHNRLGELTPMGVRQHRGIALRMFQNFPEVFSGDAFVDAKSTIVIRCILSMESALQQLSALNPRLRITHDASQHDMYYMNLQDRKLYNQKWPREVRNSYEDFCLRHADHLGPMERLFNDTAYAHSQVNLYRLNLAYFKFASSAQGTEIGRYFDMYDIYTPEELYNNWLQVNAYWYILYGACPMNGGQQPFVQRNLLRKIIEEADSCIAQPTHGATLRYGHETIVLPLVCLLGLDGFDQQINDLEKLVDNGWVNYKVFPMAANIQFIFYRKDPQDHDVLFKILLNEEEAILPLSTDCAPYYHWTNFRDFYLRKLDSYKE
ncbi:MAG: histidine-type phosphatase [Prevotella sp.]|nr:histidine-type phosphatase [Prevotella sp.]